MFYTFSQNNSFGSFDFSEALGLTHHVVVEGDSSEDILERAKNIGIYFDGCDTGQDCPCCGDRWDEPWDADEFTEAPEVFGQPVDNFTGFSWMDKGKEICVHYKDGRKEWYGVNERTV